jgi:hypothetical protein
VPLGSGRGDTGAHRDNKKKKHKEREQVGAGKVIRILTRGGGPWMSCSTGKEAAEQQCTIIVRKCRETVGTRKISS